ncbi:hypothetical protein YPPY07_1760, partial [Yersinia pestis PY-07]
MAFFR